MVPQAKNQQYSLELKHKVVQEYLSEKDSAKGLCLRYSIRDEHIVRRWIKQHNDHKDFKQSNNSAEIYMAKRRKTTLEERAEIVSYCIAENKDYGKAMKRYGISYQQVYGWVRKYQKEGTDGLTDGRGKRKDEETMSEVENCVCS